MDSPFCAKKLGLKELRVNGDSQVVIEWINGHGKIQVISIISWLVMISWMINGFEKISYEHIYKEFNDEEYALSRSSISEGYLQFQYFRHNKIFHHGRIKSF